MNGHDNPLYADNPLSFVCRSRVDIHLLNEDDGSQKVLWAMWFSTLRLDIPTFRPNTAPPTPIPTPFYHPPSPPAFTALPPLPLANKPGQNWRRMGMRQGQGSLGTTALPADWGPTGVWLAQRAWPVQRAVTWGTSSSSLHLAAVLASGVCHHDVPYPLGISKWPFLYGVAFCQRSSRFPWTGRTWFSHRLEKFRPAKLLFF